MSTRRAPSRRRGRQRRRGLVIVVVAVVILLISLAAFGFLMLMQTENKAARARGDQLQAEAVAASGSEYLASILEAPRIERPQRADTDDIPDLFGGILVDGDPDDESARQGWFSVLVANYSREASRSWRFGYENESAKLNLAQLVEWDRRQPGLGREALMNLPDMDESTADAILDWIDRDSNTRDLGAEADYYTGLDPPRRPRNGPPPSLEEILLVRGVTREKLFGIDLNANFRADSWESDLARDQAETFSDTQIPWAQFLTVRSGERDESADGKPRIQLNQANLGKLQNELSTALEPTWANFIVAYRQFGPYRGSGQAEDPSNLTVDLSKPAKLRIRSPLDLIGVRVAIPDESESASGPEPKSRSKSRSKSSAKPKMIVSSPFTTDPGQMREFLPKLMDRVTVGNGKPIFGRVNINLAPREVLLGVPDIDSAIVERVLSARNLMSLDDPGRSHAVWLLAEEIVDRSKMRRLERCITVSGDVGRAQIIGYFDLRSPIARFETVLDATEIPARRVYYKDLRRLGRGSLEDVMNVTNTP